MKKKGGKLPSVQIEGRSESHFELVNGHVVRVCATCRSVLEAGRCPNGH